MLVPELRVIGAMPHVGREMSGAGEVGGVADLEEDAGCGPDADAGHRGQDPGKRVCIEYPLDLGGDLFSLLENGFEAVRESGQDRVCGRGAGDGNGLLAERGHDRLDRFVAHARRVDLGDHGEFAAAGPGDAGRRRSGTVFPARPGG